MTTLHLVTDATTANANAQPYEDLGDDRATAGQRRSRREGAEFDQIALEFLTDCGAVVVKERFKVDSVTVGALIRGVANDKTFWVFSHGNADYNAAHIPGLQRTDTVRKAGCWAYVVGRAIDHLPVLLITSHLPVPGTSADRQLFDLRPLFLDVVATNDDEPGRRRLINYFTDPGPLEVDESAPWQRPCSRQLSLASPFDKEGC